MRVVRFVVQKIFSDLLFIFVFHAKGAKLVNTKPAKENLCASLRIFSLRPLREIKLLSIRYCLFGCWILVGRYPVSSNW